MGTTDKMQTKSEKGNGIAVGITVYNALTSTGLCSRTFPFSSTLGQCSQSLSTAHCVYLGKAEVMVPTGPGLLAFLQSFFHSLALLPFGCVI